MAIQSSYRLPQEVFIITVSNLPLRDLVAASLVSRTWNEVAFPHLYHNVYLSLERHLKGFEDRLARDGNGKRSVRFCTRNLILETPRLNSTIQTCEERPIMREDVYRIETVVSQLTRLYHFSWNLRFFPKGAYLVKRLQSGCLNLRSINWAIKRGPQYQDYDFHQYFTLFEFRNLTHFALSLDYTHLHHDEPHPYYALNHLIKACPGLESLTVCLRDTGPEGMADPVEALSTVLYDAMLPSLHTFRLIGPVDPGWAAFFDQPDSHPLRTFFSRHPNIRNVGFGWVGETLYDQSIDPEDMARVFPSLTHIEAPPFVCAPILSSRLSQQLESLVAIYNSWFVYEPDLKIIARAIAPLPKLRRLIVHGDSSDQYSLIAVEPLKTMLSAMPVLEELALHTLLHDHDQDELFDILRLVPGLRVLGVEVKDMLVVQGRLGVANLPECIPAFLQVCPRLKRINTMSAYETTESWSIGRKPDGNSIFTRAIPCSWPDTEDSI